MSDKINNKILENSQSTKEANPKDYLQMLTINKQQNPRVEGGQGREILCKHSKEIFSRDASWHWTVGNQ